MADTYTAVVWPVTKSHGTLALQVAVAWWLAHLTAMWEDQGSIQSIGGCVYCDSCCDIQPWARAVQLCCSAQVNSAFHPSWDSKMSISLHTHTHTRLTALCPGLPGWASTTKVKPIWILLEQETVSGSGISWATCKSAPRSRQITTPAPHHSVFYRPDALPAAQPTVSKHWRHFVIFKKSDSLFGKTSCGAVWENLG